MFMEKSSIDEKYLHICIYMILSVVLVIVMYPLYFILIASISDANRVNLGEVILTVKGLNWDGYKLILKNNDIWTGYRNTIFYTVVGTCLNLALTLPAAYALSRKDLAGRNLFSLILAFTMFFSGGLIPLYFVVKSLGLLNTAWALILPNAVSVWNVIIARTFFQSTIPDELSEAAAIDGCSDFKFFVWIALPLSKAVVAVLTLFYAVAHWNAFFHALLFINSKSLYPLQLVLRDILVTAQFMQDMISDSSQAGKSLQVAESMKYGVIVVASLPILVLYPFLQKYFMQGVMIGAIKG
jgi:putative aldouronate transport system permease protein